jgi:pimeloyl-ACP methyl ester carboxylesterase
VGIFLALALLSFVAAPARADEIDRLPVIPSLTSARFNYLSTSKIGAREQTSYGSGVQIGAERVSIESNSAARTAPARFARVGGTLSRDDGSGWRRANEQPVGPTYVATLAAQLGTLQESADSIVEIGAETIGATPTTHYQVTLERSTIPRLIGDTTLLSQRARDRLGRATYKVDLWISQAESRLYQHLVTVAIPSEPVAMYSTLVTYTGFEDASIGVADVPTLSPRFDPAECPVDVPEVITVDCGYLVVPETHARPDGATVRLAVAIVRSPNPQKAPDPFVYLEGGPGGGPVADTQSYIQAFAPLLANRDMILFDQRGTGFSQPALDCPEVTELNYENLPLDLTPAEAEAKSRDAVERCAARLTADGASLPDYNSAENAADLNALRVVLGYPEWNLVGISYGTRLALTAMRDTPQGIRSVILDSTYPPQVDLFTTGAANTDRAFRTLFGGCAADPTCSATYPDLENVFYGLVDRLNAEPVTFDVVDQRSGELTPALIDGDSLISILFQMLYSSQIIPALPELIYTASQGDYTLLNLATNVSVAGSDSVSIGMYYAVQCSEEAPFTSPAQAEEAGEENPRLREARGTTRASVESLQATCESFTTRSPRAAENEPVASGIPTLVLAGQYDPITPPVWGQIAAGTLPNSFFFEAPSTGHGVAPAGECQGSIAAAFLNNPTGPPDASCLGSIGGPRFTINDAPITLVPFTNQLTSVKGVAPEGWPELLPGTFVRTALGDAVLTQVALPGGAERVETIAAALREQGFQPVGTREANGLTWTLYNGVSGLRQDDVAITPGANGALYLVELISMPADREALSNAVFLPAIDAFQPGR